jgi:hypothetical protein
MASRGVKKGKVVSINSTNISWEIIERQFVQGLLQPNGEVYYPTLTEISEAHDIPYSTVHRRMNEGQWINKRENWQAKLHKWVSAANMDDYIKAADRFNETCITAAQRAMDHILMHIDTASADGKVLDQLSLDRLGRAAVNWQKAGRLALGLSTENNSNRNSNENESPSSSVDISLLSEQEVDILDNFISKMSIKAITTTAQIVEE